jgi:hypothetical protein
MRFRRILTSELGLLWPRGGKISGYLAE